VTGDCLCLNLGIECWCVRPGPGGLGYAPHGTLAAARRHYRHDGPGWRCRPCRQAEQRAEQDRPARLRIRPAPSPAGLAAARAVREMRLAAGMTQGALAGALGTSQSNVSAWEQGKYGSGPDLLARVAAVTGEALERAA
jgi:DNA-binding XRE family transcriptional regulator